MEDLAGEKVFTPMPCQSRPYLLSGEQMISTYNETKLGDGGEGGGVRLPKKTAVQNTLQLQ